MTEPSKALRSRGHRTALEIITALTMVALSALPAHRAAAASGAPRAHVSVKIDGVKGDLRRNVLVNLGIAHKGVNTEAAIRENYAHADKEIHEAIEPFGYYSPIVQAELTNQGRSFTAHFDVEPGPPMTVDSVQVLITGAGENDPLFRGLAIGFPLRRGDVLVHPTYEAAKKVFLVAAMRHGYLDAQFSQHDLEVDLTRYTARIVLVYATGPQYHFGPVTFRQDVVDPNLLAGYVTFKRGEVIDFNKLLVLEESLNKSPYFSRVEVRPDRSAAVGNELPIVVDLVPAKPEKYTLGVGYGTDGGPRTNGIAELRRINRRGHRAEADGTLSAIEQSVAAQYAVPWPFPRSDVLTFSGGYRALNTTTSLQRTTFVGAGMTRLWSGWNETFGLNFRRENFEVGIDKATESFLVPEAGWGRLDTDDPVDPGNGRRLRFRVSGAHKSLLSAASYARVEIEPKWVQTFARSHRFLLRVNGGYTWTTEFHKLPPSARFFAGGAQSVRGYEYLSLGPRDSTGHVTGGSALAVASLEYEYRFSKFWGAATFFDAGNALARGQTQLAEGTGAGVRWLSPVGLVRLDLGIPLTGNRRRMQVHVSIGPDL